MKKLQPHQRTLIYAIVVSIVIAFVPYVSVLLLPVFYLNTHLHELSHALAGYLTGSQVENIHVYAAGNGETFLTTQHPLIVGSAGYIGAIILGGLMIVLSRTETGARSTLRVLSVVLLCSLVVLVRGDMIGELSGALWVIALWGLSLLRGTNVMLVSQFIGLQQCLNALYSVFYLLGRGRDVQSDATIVSNATGLPPMLWSMSWSLLSVLVGVVCLRAAWVGAQSRRMPKPNLV